MPIAYAYVLAYAGRNAGKRRATVTGQTKTVRRYYDARLAGTHGWGGVYEDVARSMVHEFRARTMGHILDRRLGMGDAVIFANLDRIGRVSDALGCVEEWLVRGVAVHVVNPAICGRAWKRWVAMFRAVAGVNATWAAERFAIGKAKATPVGVKRNLLAKMLLAVKDRGGKWVIDERALAIGAEVLKRHRNGQPAGLIAVQMEHRVRKGQVRRWLAHAMIWEAIAEMNGGQSLEGRLARYVAAVRAGVDK